MVGNGCWRIFRRLMLENAFLRGLFLHGQNPVVSLAAVSPWLQAVQRTRSSDPWRTPTYGMLWVQAPAIQVRHSEAIPTVGTGSCEQPGVRGPSLPTMSFYEAAAVVIGWLISSGWPSQVHRSQWFHPMPQPTS